MKDKYEHEIFLVLRIKKNGVCLTTMEEKILSENVTNNKPLMDQVRKYFQAIMIFCNFARDVWRLI